MNTLSAAKKLKYLASLMELAGENEYKIRAYENAGRSLSFRAEPLTALIERAETQKIRGIGPDILEFLKQLLTDSKPPIIINLEGRIDPQLLELLKIKGLGAKKILLLSEKLQIKNFDDLLESINSKTILNLKGFGDKSVKTLHSAINFYLSHRGWIRLDEHEDLISKVKSFVLKENPKLTFIECSDSYTKAEIFNSIDFLTSEEDLTKITTLLEKFNFSLAKQDKASNKFLFTGHSVNLTLHYTSLATLDVKKFTLSCTPAYLDQISEQENFNAAIKDFKNEIEFYKLINLQYQFPETRHTYIKKRCSRPLIKRQDLRGVIHTHTDYSDGLNTISEMQAASHSLGFEYIVISDHSQSAKYANGLTPERIAHQSKEIKTLNLEKPFCKIFHGIESDILKNGSLDYSNDTLKELDLVISSIHSNFELTKNEMTARVISALQNQYTKILGHPTGRLLLQREAYQLDIELILKEAQISKVVIELNANPKRLDLSWKHLARAKEMGIKFSISPDAHSVDQISYVDYGILMARKAGIEAEDVINCLNLKEFEEFLCKKG